MPGLLGNLSPSRVDRRPSADSSIRDRGAEEEGAMNARDATFVRARVLRVADLPIPKRIVDEDFDELCRTSRIVNPSHRRALRKWLDDVVGEFSNWIRDARRQPDAKSDRKRLRVALNDIRAAVAAIEQLGPSGRLALKAISP